MTDWTKIRPSLVDNVSTLGIGKAIYAAPDGNKDTARLLIAADGFHFTNTDFDDLKLLQLNFSSSGGKDYVISFDNQGDLLVNGALFTAPSNQSNETIKGDKTYSGKTYLKGGMQLVSPSGTLFDVSVTDSGDLKAERTALDGNSNDSEKN